MDFWKKSIGGAVRVLKDRVSRIDVSNSPRAEPATLADEAGQPLFVPPGHYYSPIVNTAQLASGKYLDGVAADPLLGVDLKEATILATFDRLARHFASIDFPETKADTHRYYFQNDFYTYGDAMFLSAMIREFKPPRIVEVGSGFSSAVILDTLDSLGAGDTKCTFIEPFPERLRMLLRPQDGQRVRNLGNGHPGCSALDFRDVGGWEPPVLRHDPYLEDRQRREPRSVPDPAAPWTGRNCPFPRCVRPVRISEKVDYR